MSRRTTGRSARRARSLFITAMLVASAVLTFSPAVRTATADEGSTGPAASAEPSPEPSAEPSPDPTEVPTPDPTEVPEPVPAPTPEPTSQPAADPTPTSSAVAPEPAPDPTTNAGGGPTLSPGGGQTPAPSSGVAPSPSSGSTPPADPPADPPAERSPRGHAIGLDPAGHGAAIAATSGGTGLRTFTIETWFVRTGPGAAIAGIAGSAPLPRTDAASLLGAIPLAARGTPDPSTSSGPAPRGARVDWLLGIAAADDVLVAGFHDTDGATHRIAGTTTVTQGDWHHAAATFDGAAFRLYLDGHLEAAIRADGVAPDASGGMPIALGTSVGADLIPHGAFEGTLDETRLWSIARAGPQIRDDMHDAIDPAAVGLVGGWSMDEGEGGILDGGTDPGLRLQLRGTTAWLDSPVPDPIAPSSPESVMAVPNGAAISVGWTPVAADDLAGYRVRRSSGAVVDPAAVPLGGWTPIGATALLDRSAVVGVSYRYTVVAVDRYGNESGPSPVATAALPPPPGAPPTVAVRLDLTASGPSPSGRLAPGGSAVAHVAMTPRADLAGATLGLSIPAGWTVTDPDRGTAAPDGSTLTWPVSEAGAGRTLTVDVGLQAPPASPVDGGPTFTATFSAWLEQPGGRIPGPELTLLVAPGVVADHVLIGRPGSASGPASYMAQDEPLAGLGRFTPFRVRFRVENHGDVAILLDPTLEFRDLAGGPPADFSAVPAGRVTPGAPMYAAREWVPVSDLAAGPRVPGSDAGGRVLGGERATIAVADLRTSGDPAETLAPVAGVAATGRNPAGTLELPPGSFSEVEFSVRATADAPYGAAYAFRLSDGGLPLAGTAIATVALGPEPPLLLSPEQRHGLAVGGPTAGAATDAIRYRLAAAADAADAAPSAPSAGAGTTATTAATTDGSATAYPLVAGAADAHGSSAAGSGACAVCHDTHAAGGRSLLNRSGPQAAVCFTCHDSAGTGASSRVEGEYADPAVPADDPATGSYYRHDALIAGTDHSLSSSDEFGGRLDRHAECADCHDPHSVTSTDSVQTSGGWTVSGRLGGASGVAVANGPAGSEPSYTFVDGVAADITLEYQLCFKCHSGFTTLPPRAPDHPSRWAEDKGLELNPDNASYHPIEAAGRNATGAMAASLGGTSPYKLWEFDPTSTIRCANCHGDSRVLGGSPPAAGSDLAPHAVASVVGADGVELNRGLLIQPYRDRVLKGSGDVYDPLDSALCLSCHGQAPFVDTTGNARPDTAFGFHGLHVAGLAGKGAIAGDIDTPNAGLGNALCSECHHRIHSTASRNDFRTTDAQSGTDGGLVLFAPNVTASDPSADPLGGALDWTRTGPSSGTCTLTCHGQVHSRTPY